MLWPGIRPTAPWRFRWRRGKEQYRRVRICVCACCAACSAVAVCVCVCVAAHGGSARLRSHVEGSPLLRRGQRSMQRNDAQRERARRGEAGAAQINLGCARKEDEDRTVLAVSRHVLRQPLQQLVVNLGGVRLLARAATAATPVAAPAAAAAFSASTLASALAASALASSAAAFAAPSSSTATATTATAHQLENLLEMQVADREGAPRHLDHRRPLAEVPCEEIGVERRRHADHLWQRRQRRRRRRSSRPALVVASRPTLALGTALLQQQVSQQDQQKVRLHLSLVHLVQHNVAQPAQPQHTFATSTTTTMRRLLLLRGRRREAARQLAQQPPRRAEEDLAVRPRAPLASHGVADAAIAADGLAALVGDALRERDGRDAARLRHDDRRLAAAPQPHQLVEQELAELRRLSAPRLALHHRRRRAADRAQQRRAMRRHRQRRARLEHLVRRRRRRRQPRLRLRERCGALCAARQHRCSRSPRATAPTAAAASAAAILCGLGTRCRGRRLRNSSLRSCRGVVCGGLSAHAAGIVRRRLIGRL